jgi:hypothetical protein
MIAPSNVVLEQAEAGLSRLPMVCPIAEKTAGVVSDYQRETPRDDRTSRQRTQFSTLSFHPSSSGAKL